MFRIKGLVLYKYRTCIKFIELEGVHLIKRKCCPSFIMLQRPSLAVDLVEYDQPVVGSL